MAQVTFRPDGITIEVAPGVNLLQAARNAGLTIDAPCCGRGTCGRCIVHVVSGRVETDSMRLIPEDIIEDGFVLACRSRVTDSDLVVAVESNTGE